MKLKPLYDRVVVLPQKSNEMAGSGIILPSVSDEKSSIGKVVWVGDGQTFEGNKVEMQAQVGDNVLYSKFAGATFKVDGKDYLIIRQADILAIMED